SQKLADFTKGEADVLRKAMGKKQRDVLDKMRPKFIEQAKAKDMMNRHWKKSGKTGKHLQPMRSTNPTLLAMRGWRIKRPISKHIIRQNIWRQCCPIT